MTQHPNQLWAAAAGWSLRVSLAELQRAAAAARSADDEDDSRGTLRSWSPSIGRSAGGHGDVVAGAAVFAPTTTGPNRYERIAADTRATVAWLVARAPVAWLVTRTLPGVPVLGDHLDALVGVADDLDPDTARAVYRWLDEADQRIRQTLGMTSDHRPLPDNPACPGCHDRLLRAQTSAPDPKCWVVVCTSGCLCRGAECGCGMSVPVAGVRHIWSSGAALAVAGLPRRRVRTRRAA